MYFKGIKGLQKILKGKMIYFWSPCFIKRTKFIFFPIIVDVISITGIFILAMDCIKLIKLLGYIFVQNANANILRVYIQLNTTPIGAGNI